MKNGEDAGFDINDQIQDDEEEIGPIDDDLDDDFDQNNAGSALNGDLDDLRIIDNLETN